MPSWLRVWTGALALALSFTIPGSAHGAFGFNDAGWEGTGSFLELARKRLGQDRVRILATLEWDSLEPGDGVIILHPTVNLDFTQASAFLREGGRLAVLDDYGSGASLFERFQIGRIRAPLRPSRMLRQNPNLAVAVPAVQVVAGQEQGRHPIVARVHQLVTNHPTGLTHPNLTPVLTIPAIGEPNTALAVTGIIAGRGRLLAMGDPSVLINLMLRYPGNRAFAEGLIDYLVEDDEWGRRGGRLILLANDFKQRGQYGGGASLVQEARDVVQGFREIIADVRRDGLPDELALVLGALAAFAAIFWAGTSAMRPYRRIAPRYARTQPLVAQGGAAGRAAVLAAPTTHRALVMLELKSALDEGLALRLGVDADLATSGLLEEIVRQDALSRRSLKLLERMFAELRKSENAVAAGQSIRIGLRQIEAMRKNVREILDEVSQRSSVRG